MNKQSYFNNDVKDKKVFMPVRDVIHLNRVFHQFLKNWQLKVILMQIWKSLKEWYLENFAFLIL